LFLRRSPNKTKRLGKLPMPAARPSAEFAFCAIR
jgi:hypothetical protein